MKRFLLLTMMAAVCVAGSAVKAGGLLNVGFEDASGTSAAGWSSFIGGYSVDDTVRHEGRGR